ncbi:DUF2577 domain-containing protein [Peribacillus loiseleuriae]|uniref:DUF2577 domain-containing protein n=1 Tax=Peribacillus loiseleuriae TaxID=1679170 RepID=UPI003CFC1DE0
MSLSNTIKKVAVGAGNASGQVRIMPADVVSPPPNLKIRLKKNNKLILPAENFIIPESLTEHSKKIQLDGIMRDCLFMTGLKTGDRLMVASIQGATSYYVLDRIN